MNKVCVVIPIHSPNPSAYELIAFAQCFKILNLHPIKVIAPEGISLTNYQQVVPDFETIFIHPKWQASLLNYNKLKLSKFFYKLFRNYEFLLTYELDAFVFRDELAYWCKSGYDYIGAPFFEGYGNATTGSKLMSVGNSGFSLRKVKAFEKMLRSSPLITPLLTPSELKYDWPQLVRGLSKVPVRFFKRHFQENVIIQEKDFLLEDTYLLQVNDQLGKNKLHIAPIQEAVKFSFELRPEYLFTLNNEQLPTGCHAWVKHNFEFWKPHIRSFGYSV